MKTIGEIFFEKTNPPATVNSVWFEKIKENPFIEDALITIELIFASGKVLRISTENLNVKDGTRDIGYLPALYGEPIIETVYGLRDNSAKVRTYALTIDGRHVEPIKEILNGNPLCGYAEISLQYEGSDIKNRFLLLRGEMVGGVVFANDEELVELEISDPKLGNEMLIPQPIADRIAFPTVPDDYNGSRFPEVYYSYPYIPCIRLSGMDRGPTFLVAHGHDYTIEKVYVDGDRHESNSSTYGWEQVYRYSDNGIPYTGVDFKFTSTVWQNESVYVSVSSEKDKNLFEVITNILLDNSDFGIDGINFGLITKSQLKAPFLNANCLINASDTRSMTSAIGYIEKTICASFPMLSPCFTGFGVGVVYTDRTYEQVTANLVLEQNLIFGRVTSLSETGKEELYNEFSIKYNYNAMNDNYEKIITASSETNALCEISQNKFGKRTMPPIESVIIYDEATAQGVINWLVNHYTLPSYYIEYEGVSSLFFLVSLGDVVTLTDEKLGFTNEKCTVEKITYSRGRSIIGLRIWVLYRTVYG